MDSMTVAALIAGFTFVVGFARSIIGGIKNCTKYIFGTIECDNYLAGIIFSHCNKTMKRLPFGSRTFFGYHGRSQGENKSLIFDALDRNVVIFRKGLRFLVVAPGDWMIDEMFNWKRGVKIYLPRIMWNTEKFIKESCEAFDAANKFSPTKKRFRVTRFYGKSNKESLISDTSKRPPERPNAITAAVLDAKIGIKELINEKIHNVEIDGFKESPFDVFPFQADVLSARDEAKWWINRQHWYKNKGIAWRRGWLLYGKPGCGKSFFIKCLAIDMDLPVFSFDLASMTNEELCAFWDKASAESPCIVVMEDFDNCFHGRQNTTKKEDGITFDTLLNCISGIHSSEGILLVITANDVSKIDPAIAAVGQIASRPGRIDRSIEMSDMSESCKLRFATYMLDGRVDLINQALNESAQMTAAQFTELCRSLIIKSELSPARHKYNGRCEEMSHALA